MDLFSTTDTAPAPSRKRVVYQGRNGRFTDKETARITQLEKDRNIYKTNSEYWKRQAERLSAEYKEEHMKVIELEKQLSKKESLIYDLNNPVSTKIEFQIPYNRKSSKNLNQ